MKIMVMDWGRILVLDGKWLICLIEEGDCIMGGEWFTGDKIIPFCFWFPILLTNRGWKNSSVSGWL